MSSLVMAKMSISLITSTRSLDMEKRIGSGIRKTPSLYTSETLRRILLIGHLATIFQTQEQGKRFHGGILFLASSLLIAEVNSSLLVTMNNMNVRHNSIGEMDRPRRIARKGLNILIGRIQLPVCANTITR